MLHLIPWIAVYFVVGGCFLLVFHESLKDDSELSGKEKLIIWSISFFLWPIFALLLIWTSRQSAE